MSAKQVFYRFYDSTGRRIDIRGFSLRDNSVVSDTPPVTNKAHGLQEMRLIPSLRPGNPINESELIQFAKDNSYSLQKSDSTDTASLNTEVIPSPTLALSATSATGSVTVAITGPDGVYEVQKSSLPETGFNIIFKGEKTGTKTHEDTNVVAGEIVYYRARFIDTDGNVSHFSPIISATVIA